MIHESAYVEEGAHIGKQTNIWHFAHVRSGVTIGDHCNIGKSVYIDSNVTIGNNCKIQNFASLYQGLTIKDDVFIGPHVCFTNDLYPRSKVWNDEKIAKTMIKKGVSIGANATIVAGITIESNAMIGAGSVVTKNVPAHGLVYGNPARLKGFICECSMKMKVNIKKESKIEYICSDCGKTILVEKHEHDEVEK